MNRYNPKWLTIAFYIVAAHSASIYAEIWKVEELAYDLQTAEGPVWDKAGKLYFSEIFANKVHMYMVANGDFREVRENSGGANGMAFGPHGQLLMCEMAGKRVSRLERNGTITTLWQAEHTGKGGPNDIAVSASGNIYFTMPKHGCIYRINSEGIVESFVSGITGVNGVMLSRDEATLYATEYKARKIHAFSLDDSQGSVGTGRLFAQIHTEGTEHGADGMAIDEQNRLYVACLGGVWIFDPKGQQVGFISIPGEKVTNCAFGETQKKLFITTQQGLFCAHRLGEE